MTDLRQKQRAWLKRTLGHSGLSGTALAKRTGLAQTTLTRFLSDPDHGSALSARTVAAIESATGLLFHDGDAAKTSVAEPEAAPYRVEGGEEAIGEVIARLSGKAVGVDPWRLKSRALEAAGYLVGDILIVDLNASPRPGDVVCAQVYRAGLEGAETVFRLYEPPLLLSKSFDPSIAPTLRHGSDDVMVRGVVILTLRRRQGRK